MLDKSSLLGGAPRPLDSEFEEDEGEEENEKGEVHRREGEELGDVLVLLICRRFEPWALTEHQVGAHVAAYAE